MNKELSPTARFALNHRFWLPHVAALTLLAGVCVTMAALAGLARVEFTVYSMSWYAVQVLTYPPMVFILAWTVGFVLARQVWVPAALAAHAQEKGYAHEQV